VATVPIRFTAASRREQIVRVATRLFARQGYQGTTTKEIARQARVTEALIFRHFASKDDLYWAVIQAKIKIAGPGEHLRWTLCASGSDIEIFSSLAAEILDRRARDQSLSRLMLYSALENHRLSQRFFRTYVADYYQVLSDHIQRRIEEGAFRPVDSLLAARGFLGMVIYHSWVQELFGGKRYQKFSVKQVSQTLADIWLQGMLQPVLTSSIGRSENGNHRSAREPKRVTQKS
jgi:AcrR family transcriptional regulator